MGNGRRGYEAWIVKNASGTREKRRDHTYVNYAMMENYGRKINGESQMHLKEKRIRAREGDS